MPTHALQVVPPAGKGKETDGLLHLAKNLNIHPDLLIADGNEIVGTGMPGAGKTTLMALLLEQFGACGLPFSAFDLEGDLRSVVDLLPRGVLGTIDNCPTAQDMYKGGLQVVFDLSTWGDDSNHAARFINQTVRDLLSLMHSLPRHDRVPFLVGLDEAAYWLPQIRRGKNYLESSQFEALFSVFHTLAIRGRKTGLVPMLFTQRFASVHNDVLSPGTYILMRQTTDTDLKRYMEYISSAAFGEDEGELTEKEMRHRIAAFKKGQAVIKLPSGKQGLVQFHNRQSLHISHAPKTQAATNLYRDVPFDPNTGYGAFQGGPKREEASGTCPQVPPFHGEPASSQPRTCKEQVFALLESDPSLTVKQITAILRRPMSTVREHVTAYFTLHPDQRPGQAPLLKGQVFAALERDPGLTARQITSKLAGGREHALSTIYEHISAYFDLHPDRRPKQAPTIKEQVFAALSQGSSLTPKQMAMELGCPVNTIHVYTGEYSTQYPEKKP